jgi:CAAX protease family protein
MELSPTRGQASAPSKGVLQIMRHHPLLCYFLLAFGFTWAWELPIVALSHQQVGGPWLLLGILGPALAGFVMAGITEGRGGMIRLLRRCVIWRVGFPWYLIALLLVPGVWLVSILFMPGGIAAFRVPSSSFLLTYLAVFALAFFAALGGEEPGWRGFALPRLQQQQGPLLGTLILGSLWALWHLPLWLFIPHFSGAGTGFLGVGIPFFGFVCYTVAFAMLITWVFNHSRGSVGLSSLFHASGGTAFGVLPLLFPSLAGTLMATAPEIGLVLVAVLIVVATRGRLSYQRYQRETALLAPVTDREQELRTAGTSV